MNSMNFIHGLHKSRAFSFTFVSDGPPRHTRGVTRKSKQSVSKLKFTHYPGDWAPMVCWTYCILSQNILLDIMNNKLFNEHKVATIFQLNEKWGLELFESKNTNYGNSLQSRGFTVAEFCRFLFRCRLEVYWRCEIEIISSLDTSAWMIFDAGPVTRSLVVSSISMEDGISSRNTNQLVGIELACSREPAGRNR